MPRQWIRVQSVAGNDKNAARMHVRSSNIKLIDGLSGVLRYCPYRKYFQVYEEKTGVLLAEDISTTGVTSCAVGVIKACKPLAPRLATLTPLEKLPVLQDQDEPQVAKWCLANMPRTQYEARGLVDIKLPRASRRAKAGAV
jgi:hypothetical protein